MKGPWKISPALGMASCYVTIHSETDAVARVSESQTRARDLASMLNEIELIGFEAWKDLCYDRTRVNDLGLEPRNSFLFHGVAVYDPFVDETGREEVDPREYYGRENFREWLKAASLVDEAERKVLEAGWKSPEQALDAMIDDRSHGDDHLAGAAADEAEQNTIGSDTVDFVRRVLARHAKETQ